jgi:signal transduction histidine kinase
MLPDLRDLSVNQRNTVSANSTIQASSRTRIDRFPMFGGLRLHHRIVVPFVLVALVTTSGAAYVALRLISGALESRVRAQILNASEVVSQSGFALNPTVLRSVKAITGADVITFTPDGAILATTVATQPPPAWVGTVIAADAAREALAIGGPSAIQKMSCGAPCYVVYRSVPRPPPAVVALVAETSELEAATRTMARTILIATGLGVLAMILVSQAVARRVTGPIDRLVRFTRDVSAGDARHRAPAGDDEVGRLGASFNDMLDRLDASRDALVKSEKLGLAGLLAARVAHDIRNPLSAIKMQAQLLRTRLRSEGHGPALDAILHDVSQVEFVIGDLLELARPGELRLGAASLNDVIREALHQVSPQLEYRKIRTAVSLDEMLPNIPLDAARFKLALLNVIVNAADAMPAGGTLEISTVRDRDSPAILLEVCDDGAGIDAVTLGRVFDPFVSTKRDGVGLGLVNARAIVEMHGGAIRLARREPKGTRVTMTLPIRQHG